MSSRSLILCLLLSIFSKSLAYFVTIDAHSEECFYEKVTEAGAKLGKISSHQVF